MRVLKIQRHTNKLRPGHLHGNRFRILIRGASVQTELPRLIDRLKQQGWPNFYGPQRFGRGGETWEMGRSLLRGGKQVTRRSPFLRKLALSAAQAGLFNYYLARRMTDGLLHRVLLGDVMSKLSSGGLFVVEDQIREQERFNQRETVTAGPIFGRKTFPAASEAFVRENAVLGDFQLTAASFAGFGKLLQGTRRHNLVFIDDLTAATSAEGVELRFTLPAGAYATVLLREIMKAEVADIDAI
jgi:tRNA pseudouridine13 synthase